LQFSSQEEDLPAVYLPLVKIPQLFVKTLSLSSLPRDKFGFIFDVNMLLTFSYGKRLLAVKDGIVTLKGIIKSKPRLKNMRASPM